MFNIAAHDSLIAHWRPRLAPVLEALLLILLAVQAARLAWIVATPPGSIGTPAPESGHDNMAGPALSGHGDLFFLGSTVTAEGHDTAQGYRLFGIRVDGSDGSAILGKEGVQAAYRVGGTITPGLVLESVANGHVLLRDGPNLLRLDMPDEPVLAAPVTTGRLPIGRPPTPRKIAGTPPDAVPEVTSSAGLKAHEDDGYVIASSGENALLQRSGLQPGDVVLAVDGRPLTADRMGELRARLQQRGKVSVTVRRDGSTRTITLQAPP